MAIVSESVVGLASTRNFVDILVSGARGRCLGRSWESWVFNQQAILALHSSHSYFHNPCGSSEKEEDIGTLYI